MATATHEITHIQIGDETFEIVDAIARDSVSVIYKWGRPSLDPRYTLSKSGNNYVFPENGNNSKQKRIVLAHILPNEQDRKLPHRDGYVNYNFNPSSTTSSGYYDTQGNEIIFSDNSTVPETKWKSDITYEESYKKSSSGSTIEVKYKGWNYPSNRYDIETILNNFSFAFGSINVHVTTTNRATLVKTFLTNEYQKNSTNPVSIQNLIDYYTDDRKVVEEWSWATFYQQAVGDIVLPSTFITTKTSDIKGTFGVDAQDYVGNLWGNATTVIFTNCTINYNNLNTLDAEPSSAPET